MTKSRNPAEFHRLRAIETDECVEWPYGKTGRGYGRLSYEGRQWYTHRLALVLATGTNPPELRAAHGPCHNIACMNVRHLRWATQSENLLDTHRDGTDRRGVKHPMVKLTEADVHEIRASVGGTQTEIAERYGVSQGAINNIIHRRSWSHI